jgi:transcriptional regulator with XRE-family HTH domain
MAGELASFIEAHSKGKGEGGGDLYLKTIADELDISASYLTDILKGRRKPLELEQLHKIADMLKLSQNDRSIMYDIAGRENARIAPDLPEYIMDEGLPNARYVLRRAKEQGLKDDFWESIYKKMEKGNNR